MPAIISLTTRESTLRLSTWPCLSGSNIQPSTLSQMPSPGGARPACRSPPHGRSSKRTFWPSTHHPTLSPRLARPSSPSSKVDDLSPCTPTSSGAYFAACRPSTKAQPSTGSSKASSLTPARRSNSGSAPPWSKPSPRPPSSTPSSSPTGHLLLPNRALVTWTLTIYTLLSTT